LEQSSVQKLSKDQEHVLKTFRILIADLCQQFNGGHPGCVSTFQISNILIHQR
jgi:dihydroxyacetone synthase